MVGSWEVLIAAASARDNAEVDAFRFVQPEFENQFKISGLVGTKVCFRLGKI